MAGTDPEEVGTGPVTGQVKGSGFYYKYEKQPLESVHQEGDVVSLRLER